MLVTSGVDEMRTTEVNASAGQATAKSERIPHPALSLHDMCHVGTTCSMSCSMRNRHVT